MKIGNTWARSCKEVFSLDLHNVHFKHSDSMLKISTNQNALLTSVT